MRDTRRPTTPAAVLVAAAVVGSARADERRPRAHRGVDPERLVRPDGTPVANGCGPGWASWQDGVSWRFANRHAYQVGGYGYCQGLPPSDPESCDGETWTYEIDFLAACNLHDVGYKGRLGVLVDGTWVEQRLVYDRILDVDVDFSRWSRAQIDEHFYQDMVALCAQQIVQQEGRAPYAARTWRHALDACECSGQGPAVGGSWGAETMYRLVRAYGDARFKDLGGRRANDRVRSTRGP
jgi:hypothetical protein